MSDVTPTNTEIDERIPKSQRSGIFESFDSVDREELMALRERLISGGNFEPYEGGAGIKVERGEDGLHSSEGYFGTQEWHRRWRFRGTFHGHLNHPGLAYSARIIEEKDHGEGYWKTGDIGVFRGEELIGSYERGHPLLFRTFEAFRWRGKDYALYSHDYQYTSAMSLPECQEIATEPEGQRGFCPTAYWVPINPATGEAVNFGFVSGCIWGDDASWKVEYLDLRGLGEGVIKRDCRFGYLELHHSDTLKDAIELSWNWNSRLGALVPHSYVTIRHAETFELGSGESEMRAPVVPTITPAQESEE